MKNNAIQLLNGQKRNSEIYRITRYEDLAEWFSTSKLTMVSPKKWEDPFEKFTNESVMVKNRHAKNNLTSLFSLCFSEDGTSDALWRLYSPNQCAVRIRINVKNLCKELNNSNSLSGGTTYIGKVRYLSGEMISRHAESKIFDPRKKQEIAKFLMMKRTPFEFEKEVRLLHFHRGSTPETLLSVELDPKKIIDTILIDPRTNERKSEMLKKYFKEVAKFEGSVEKSSIYRAPRM